MTISKRKLNRTKIIKTPNSPQKRRGLENPFIDIESFAHMIVEYIELKVDNVNELLFYRMDDCYEVFFNDAIILEREYRNELDERFKHFSILISESEDCFEDLLKKGYRLAIFDQGDLTIRTP